MRQTRLFIICVLNQHFQAILKQKWEKCNTDLQDLPQPLDLGFVPENNDNE